MLLAVEGGRFFSSSASGYSNGLNLLFLGHKKEEKPMKVTPWTQYHLVDQEPDPNTNPNPNPNPNHLQLAANKNNCCGCGCASLACFGCTDTATARPAREVVKTASNLEKIEENFGNLDCVEGEEGNSNGINVNSLKSSLKRRGAGVGVSVSNDDEVGPVENERSVHWTDVTGGELCAIREFEPSEHSDLDDEFENSSGKTCACRIM